jgi:hypothetical protein
MKRAQLEHILRASSAITEDTEFIVIGSQSVLGQHPDAPVELLRSMEADLYPKNKPEQSIAIDGAIGEGSLFHQTFGYYAHGVAPETAVLPAGWEKRLVRIQNANTRDAVGWCLDTGDLAASKLVAGREHDREFVAALLRHNLLTVGDLISRIALLALPPDQQQRIEAVARAITQR